MSEQSNQIKLQQANQIQQPQFSKQDVHKAYQDDQNFKKFTQQDFSKISQFGIQFLQHEKYVDLPPYQQNVNILNTLNIFYIVKQNSIMINNLNQILSNLQERMIEVQKQPDKLKVQTDPLSNLNTPKKQSEYSKKNRQSQILEKLFSDLFVKKPINQKYEIVLVNNLDHTFYKQRNFKIRIKICRRNYHDQTIKNSSPLNLCMGVFNNEREWVTHNKSGQSILKGKTQVQLFNGEEAIFQKIYFRASSSLFTGGKLNIVVYVKPSTIKYECMGFYSQNIEWDDIYPLFIKNLKVLSRKNSKTDNWKKY